MRIDIVMPSYRSEYLTCLAIKSFEQNKSTFDFRECRLGAKPD